MNLFGKQRFHGVMSYDGFAFHGWQRQSGVLSVQELVENVFLRIFAKRFKEFQPIVHASGRTDASAHALAQHFHVDLPRESGMMARQILHAANALLPNTVRIISFCEVEDEFHARFSAKWKIYRYDICVSETVSPFLHNRAWLAPFLAKAAKRESFRRSLFEFVGSRNFAAFSAKRGDRGDDINRAWRLVHEVSFERVETYLPDYELWRAKIRASGFLYKMVRFMIGTVAVLARRQGELAPFIVRDLLLKSVLCAKLANNEGVNILKKQTFPAPAYALYLEKVQY